MNIIVGSHVWVEDPALAWIDGEVLDIRGEDAEIQTSAGKMVNSSFYRNTTFIRTNKSFN